MLISFATPNFLSLLTDVKLHSMERSTTYHHEDSYEGERVHIKQM